MLLPRVTLSPHAQLIVINVTVRTHTCALLVRTIGTRGHKWLAVHASSDGGGFSGREGPKEVRRN